MTDKARLDFLFSRDGPFYQDSCGTWQWGYQEGYDWFRIATKPGDFRIAIDQAILRVRRENGAKERLRQS